MSTDRLDALEAAVGDHERVLLVHRKAGMILCAVVALLALCVLVLFADYAARRG